MEEQVLESVLVGPLALGVSAFLLEAPSPARVVSEPRTNTLLLLACAYHGQRVLEVGYYVREESDTQERHILSERPYTTYFCVGECDKINC